MEWLGLCGSIPAWAGATVRTFGGTVQHRVHPRVGGGDPRLLSQLAV